MTNSIKVERARKNITQGQLAEMVGVSRQTINAIELGKYNPLDRVIVEDVARIRGKRQRPLLPRRRRLSRV